MKRSSVVLTTIRVACFVLLLNALTAVVNSTLAVASPRPVAIQKSSKDARSAQGFVTREVRHELVMLPYYSLFDWLEFQVQSDDTIVLKGQVTRPTLKSGAENVVKKVEGVQKVINEIEVLPTSSNDDRIRRAVYRALFDYDSPLFRYSLGAVPPIHIVVNNGKVTLKGAVSTQSDSDTANIKAKSVSGVFAVTNELKVEKSSAD